MNDSLARALQGSNVQTITFIATIYYYTRDNHGNNSFAIEHDIMHFSART